MCKTVHTANQISPQYIKIVKDTTNRLHLRANTCCLKNHGYESPMQALETDSATSCGVLYPPLCGIISNSLWLLDNSTNKFHYAELMKFESHYNFITLVSWCYSTLAAAMKEILFLTCKCQRNF